MCPAPLCFLYLRETHACHLCIQMLVWRRKKKSWSENPHYCKGHMGKILNYTQLCQNNIFEGYDISLYQHTDKCHTLHISYLNEFCQVWHLSVYQIFLSQTFMDNVPENTPKRFNIFPPTNIYGQNFLKILQRDWKYFPPTNIYGHNFLKILPKRLNIFSSYKHLWTTFPKHLFLYCEILKNFLPQTSMDKGP